MIRVLAAAALLLLTAVAPVQAQPGTPPQAVIDRCTSGPDGGSNGVAVECIYRQVDVEDVRLNRAYKAALARLNAAQQKSLRAEQRAWLKGRDDCPFSREEDGADFVLLVADCVYQRTHDRADELERYRRR